MRNRIYLMMACLSISLAGFLGTVAAQDARTLSGTVITPQFQAVPGVSIAVQTAQGTLNTTSDTEGKFSIGVSGGSLIVVFSGKNLATVSRQFSAAESVADLQIKLNYVIPPVTETVTIVADALTPDIEMRNDALYKNTLFGRDDQLIQSLNAGINAGQHEGGGKSLEVRRFGFNLDHGGVNGGTGQPISWSTPERYTHLAPAYP